MTKFLVVAGLLVAAYIAGGLTRPWLAEKVKRVLEALRFIP